MNLRYQIEVLRRRFWQGDKSARDALQCLLRRYVGVIVRRAARRTITPFDASGRIRIRERDGGIGFSERGANLIPESICRHLCDELLQRPSEGKASVGAVCSIDTVRAVLQTGID
jgi:hypothetical protein